MKYLSLCSGVEAATVAWEPLGWQAMAFAEYEAFPSAVLAHHYPDVPNLGDLTLITEQQIKDLDGVDIVVAGTPCQDLSVAGKGAGLDGERSGLYRTALTIFDWCRKHHGTRFFLWENVPGAFSSSKGADFTEVVKSLAGLDDLDKPKHGWGKEGCAVGDNGMLEWACLDAQFFGLAQRRKRVFAILDTGDWASRPPILLERESVRGDTAPSRETRKEIPPNAGVGTEASGPELIGAISSQKDGSYPDQPLGTLTRGSPNGGGEPLPAVAFSAGNSAKARSVGLSVEHTPPLRAAASGTNQIPTVCYATKGTAIGRQAHNGGNGLGVEEELSPTLTVADRHGVATGSTMKARDFKGPTDLVTNVWPKDVTCTLSAAFGSKLGLEAQHINGGASMFVPAALDAFNQTTDHISKTVAARNDQDTASLAITTGVRRLTEIECERLQGVPDNYTNVPYKGKPDAPMGQRYKALGNSMAVPVMRYIGEQIGWAVFWSTDHSL